MAKVKKINVRNTLLKCAFCKHWYDPTNSHIRPVKGDAFMNWWEYDVDVDSMCDILHKQVPSQGCCTKIERKIPK